MDNKSKLTKWLTGFFIFLALLLTANHFIELSVDIFLFGFVSIGSYMGIYFIKNYRNISVKAGVIVVVLILLIYGTDYALTAYTEMRQQDLVLQNGTQLIDQAEGKSDQIKRHEVVFIHSLRDFLSYEKGFEFGEWLVFERIQDQLLSGEDISFNKKYEFYFLILLSLAITLLLSLVFDVKWLKIVLVLPIALYVWLWYQFIDLPWIITGLYFGGLVAYFIMDHHEKLLKTHQGYNTSYYPASRLMVTSLVTGLVVIVLSGLITFVFPIKQVNLIVDLVTPNLWGARSGYSNEQLKMYSLKETAFRGSLDILGGPVGPINTEDPIFWVKFNRKIDKAIYLKTSIKDQYDGLKWINNGTVYKNGFKYYLNNIDNTNLLKSDAFDEISGTIKINKKQTKTVTLFTPMGLYETSLGDKRIYVSAENEAFYKAGAFVKFLNEYTFSATQRDFYITPEVNYLQISNRLETRTLELAKTLGGLAETDYEKMVVFSEFLSKNYEYSLTPLSNRNQRDFVSEFLFESKKGYCTYFATSLAILARINGIPSRYVEGFRVDPGEVGEVDAFSKVTERDAHAWAEVYLDGYGWVVFESTPPYSDPSIVAAVPTLEELLGEAEKPEDADVNSGVDTTLEPMDLEDLMAEGDGGRGDFEGTAGNGDQVDTRSSFWLVLYGALGIMLLVIAYLVSRLPINYMRKHMTHAFATRSIYYLAYLTAESNNYTAIEPEIVFKRAGYSKSELNLWLRILYDQRERISNDMIVKAVDTSSDQIKNAIESYKVRKGKIAYIKMRLFKIDKLIP